MAQELGAGPGAIPVLPVLGTGDRVEITSGRYGTLQVTGERDGILMATFSAPWALAEVDLNTPSLAYLAVLATGLSEAHGLGVVGRATYLAGLPGTAPRWDAAGLATALG